MKRILVVFLLFVSLNVFAQKQEIGRIIFDMRNYENDFRGKIPDRLSMYHYKELAIHITKTVPDEYLWDPRHNDNTFEAYRDIALSNDPIDIIDPNHFILYWPYKETSRYGAWTPVNVLMDFAHDPELSPNIRERFRDDSQKPSKDYNLDNTVQAIVVIMNHFNEGTFTWDDGWDFDHEEYYYTDAIRVDENGVKHKSFRVTYIIYKE
jgi:hypothetical protein